MIFISYSHAKRKLTPTIIYVLGWVNWRSYIFLFLQIFVVMFCFLKISMLNQPVHNMIKKIKPKKRITPTTYSMMTNISYITTDIYFIF